MTKNVLFLTASFAALFAIGCSGDDEVKGTGDTGSAAGDDDDDTGTPAPNEFDDATLAGGVICSGTTVDFEFDFLGESSGGVLDAADSANASNWNDYHTLLASGVATDGSYTLLSATGITTGAAVADWADGTSTVFTCDLHYNDPAVMSYIARAYDINGAFLDCVAWGDDPAGMIAGDYDEFNPMADTGELDGCRTAAAAK